MNWQLMLCLILSWLLIYLCICKGVKSSGKVVYFTATFPYVLLTILMIRAVTLPDAINGIYFYLNPNISRLADSQVWMDAATQIFFSYSIGLGTMAALGSYNKFNVNFVRDAVIFACTNSGTSLYSGFVIFSVLGFMAGRQGVEVADVATSGPGLVFIAYPEGISQMPIAPLWAFLFFFMLIILGIDSQFVGVEGFVTAFIDLFPNYLLKGSRREYFAFFTCLGFCIAGLPMVTYGGMYVFQLFDNYSASGAALLFVSFFESVAIGWVYGRYIFSLSLFSHKCALVRLGPGLVFIAYPEGISQMPIAPLWAFLFFFMLIILGIDSQFVGVEGFVTAFIDLFPNYLLKGSRREYFAFFTCLGFCIAGLPMVTYGGMYVFQLFDNYSASGAALLFVSFFESVAIGWVYGADRFIGNFKTMHDFRALFCCGQYLRLTWMITTPCFAMAIFIFSLVEYKPLKYNDVYVYPWWGYMIGWMMSLSSMICPPTYFCYQLIFNSKGSLKERWTMLTTPRLTHLRSNDEVVEEVPDLEMIKVDAHGENGTSFPPSYDEVTENNGNANMQDVNLNV
eukprot:XP_011676091.1 PREDICTED: sodium- and chloride-dependent taurine transporter [Strongylocentrotus purpuratus]